MSSLAEAIVVLATLSLGLSAGALLAEGAVLVPFWRGMTPASFLAWYRAHAELLFKFFGPLEIVAAGLTLAALAAHWLTGAASSAPLFLAALLAVAVLLAFPLYFQKVNASFAAGTIAPERVADELRRWARWHWCRTGLGIGAFACAALAL